MEGAPETVETMENSDEKKSSIASSDMSDGESSPEEELYEVDRIMGMSKGSVSVLSIVYCTHQHRLTNRM